mmetsp:Transcript_2574/g.6816  ORF Transcript_2574/g.6816 Transcript_2574/m.6816 type:complete len:212 (-) Transcript_2574:36-671(-)
MHCLRFGTFPEAISSCCRVRLEPTKSRQKSCSRLTCLPSSWMWLAEGVAPVSSHVALSCRSCSIRFARRERFASSSVAPSPSAANSLRMAVSALASGSSGTGVSGEACPLGASGALKSAELIGGGTSPAVLAAVGERSSSPRPSSASSAARFILRSSRLSAEFHRFLIELSVRPGRHFAIMDHFEPCSRCACSSSWSSSKVHGPRLIAGSS